MRFALTEDQQLLKESVERYLEKEYDFARRTKILGAGGFSADRWKGFSELGWLAAPFPQDAGGLGMGGGAVFVIMQAFGRHLVLEPYVWTVIVGGRLLLEGAPASRREELLG